MACRTIRMGDGCVALVCGTFPRQKPCCAHNCGKRGTYLCDWKVSRSLTCSAPICADHADEVGQNKHLCPEHAAQWRKIVAQYGEMASPP